MARREEILKERPELKSNVTELSKIIGAEWRQMSDEQKKPYQVKHEEEKLRYLREKEEHEGHQNLQNDGEEAKKAPPAKSHRRSSAKVVQPSDEEEEIDESVGDEDEEIVKDEDEDEEFDEEQKSVDVVTTENAEVSETESKPESDNEQIDAKDSAQSATLTEPITENEPKIDSSVEKDDTTQVTLPNEPTTNENADPVQLKSKLMEKSLLPPAEIDHTNQENIITC